MGIAALHPSYALYIFLRERKLGRDDAVAAPPV